MPIHIPPDSELNVHAPAFRPNFYRDQGPLYDVVVFPELASFIQGMQGFIVSKMHSHGKICVLLKPNERSLILPVSLVPNGEQIQLVNENLIDDHLHCIFRINRRLSAPCWDCQSDGTILVHSDVGFGDDFFAARHPVVLKSLGRKFLFEARAEEASLMQACSYYDGICIKGLTLPPHDWQIGVSDLNAASGMVKQAYLKQPCGLNLGDGFKVGVVLEGHYVKIGPKRSLSASLFADCPQGLQLHLLQKTDHRQRKYDLPHNMVSPVLGDWLDTARYVASMDYIVSVDTSMVHLAAALGKKVKVLLKPEHHNCYFPVGCPQSPFYPSKRVKAYWGEFEVTVSTALRDIVREMIKIF
jgi:hypothetical protein